MNYKNTISVRFSSDEYEKIIEKTNQCEGLTFSDRLRTYLRQSVRDA